MTKELYAIDAINLTDFIGRPAITLYFSGCNFDCQYCFNKNIVNGAGKEKYSLDDALAIYSKLRGTINLGVVFSGGEPTTNPFLKRALQVFAFAPKGIHTNGVVLPDAKYNPFESVVLSVKNYDDYWKAYRELEYIYLMVRATKYYSTSKNKELRYVETETAGRASGARIIEKIKSLGGDINGWKINFVREKNNAREDEREVA